MSRWIAIACLALLASGCATGKQRQAMESEIEQLKAKLSQSEAERQRLEADLASAKSRVQQKSREADELTRAQRQLAESLQQELGDARAKLAMTERGLVLTFLAEVFFDSGKAEVKPEGMPSLEKVATVLRETVADSSFAVEGHTDSEPIRYSGWKSNWELSAARALAVLHYFVDQQGIAPGRARAVAFGEQQPVAPNDTPEGRRQNRRVEVVILPKVQKLR